jgi:hypothetical protein
LFPSTTTTRVSSAWVASMSIFLAMFSVCTRDHEILRPDLFQAAQSVSGGVLSRRWFGRRAVHHQGGRERPLLGNSLLSRASSRFFSDTDDASVPITGPELFDHPGSSFAPKGIFKLKENAAYLSPLRFRSEKLSVDLAKNRRPPPLLKTRV